MGRLIDADRLIDNHFSDDHEIAMSYANKCWMRRIINSEPTVDAVEVVRCGKCKNYHAELGWCDLHSHFIGDDGEACHPSESANWKMFNDDDFCSDGERRNDETD